MLLPLLLLLPMCWAVEVKRPRGVSLTSESSCSPSRQAGGGRGQHWALGIGIYNLLPQFPGSAPLVGVGGQRWYLMEKALSCPGLSFLHPTDHHFYDESKPFTCLDGSATIPFDQVNDDYCDCKDGSDEPGEPFLCSSIRYLLNTAHCQALSV